MAAATGENRVETLTTTLQEKGDRFRRILQVGVEQDHPLASGGRQGGEQGALLAVILFQGQDPDGTVTLSTVGDLAGDGEGIIRRGVVDQDQLVGDFAERPTDPCRQLFERGSVAIDRDDDTDFSDTDFDGPLRLSKRLHPFNRLVKPFGETVTRAPAEAPRGPVHVGDPGLAIRRPRRERSRSDANRPAHHPLDLGDDLLVGHLAAAGDVQDLASDVRRGGGEAGGGGVRGEDQVANRTGRTSAAARRR